jgi:phage shock protein PspC (stress-responsive transcriptional regulator)
MIFGVCERLEKNTGIDAWFFRVLFILFGFSGTGILIYFLLNFFI